MSSDSQYNRLLQESLKGELRIVNAHLPLRQKSLADLLTEEYPHALCQDGSTHLFRRKELEYIASLLAPGEAERLRLPILIEVKAGEGELAVISPTEVEAKVMSRLLGMELAPREARIAIYKPQLSVIRRQLRTATQYVFPPDRRGQMASLVFDASP